MKRFAKNNQGATAIEYGLIIALIALIMMTGLLFTKNGIETTFNTAGNALETN